LRNDFLGDNSGGRQDAQGDGQIESRAFFFDVRRCQIYSDAVIGKTVTGVVDGRFSTSTSTW
jgi:hypothetical protein